ncbi:uncharacterized protein Z520_11690 [Fonsecaea multimorphosa CBS 102226]|uniref:Uncharacterized protein n=1 Tax=Fonsecaea multimorphosa CBS 102226 TaxID=1442371 RepID=A0A0D2I5W8_9EURO|nr:uncharacterized protein Z520_11690 [Fonsecaea multimorphosa CBS 102226]KIX92661.1 hypothetical protein Z520_11690 [Fonsecaea multimorphosa CBS 102226]OAL17884.1 hypothetical protein AYO22_11228 [Fonsecaea multimorphosa]
MSRPHRTTTTHITRVTETLRDNMTSKRTEEVIITKSTSSTTSSLMMNMSQQSNGGLERKSKANTSNDDVMRRFLEDRDHVIDRLHRDSGDRRSAVGSVDVHNAGVRKRTEEYVKVIERKPCRM